MNFKTVKYFKIEWLKNITESGGALHETIKKSKPNHVVVQVVLYMKQLKSVNPIML